MTDLIGSRVILRPLRPEDWDVWREVRLRTMHAAPVNLPARPHRPAARRRGKVVNVDG